MKLNKSNVAAMSLSVFGFLALLFCLPARADAQMQVYNDFSPVDYRVIVPCSDEEVIVLLSGTLHTTYGFRHDAGGGYHLISHANWQGVSGVNEQTGEVYNFVTVGTSSFNSSEFLPFTSTTVNRSAAIGTGGGIVFYIRSLYHVTIDEQGEISTQFLHETAECKNEIEPVQE